MWTHLFLCKISIFQNKTCLWGELGRLASALPLWRCHRLCGGWGSPGAREAVRVKRASNPHNYHKSHRTIGPPERPQGPFGVPAHTLRTTHHWGKLCKGTAKPYCQLLICRSYPSSSLKHLLPHKVSPYTDLEKNDGNLSSLGNNKHGIGKDLKVIISRG